MKVILYGNDCLGKEIYLHYFPDAIHIPKENITLKEVREECPNENLLLINTFSRPAVSAKTFCRIVSNSNSSFYLGCEEDLGLYSYRNNSKICPPSIILVYNPVAPNFKCLGKSKCTIGTDYARIGLYILIGIAVFLLLILLIVFLAKRRKTNITPCDIETVQSSSSIIINKTNVNCIPMNNLFSTDTYLSINRSDNLMDSSTLNSFSNTPITHLIL